MNLVEFIENIAIPIVIPIVLTFLVLKLNCLAKFKKIIGNIFWQDIINAERNDEKKNIKLFRIEVKSAIIIYIFITIQVLINIMLHMSLKSILLALITIISFPVFFRTVMLIERKFKKVN